ncbi:MAG: glycerol-3-phosphate acyltransferase [Chloroflexi bacterium]|nr:glycerol-3-phosphate acyltransferase [Chloroflexota bacterium]
MSILYYVLPAILGYLIGSIPVGMVVVWVTKGVDIRTIGSGRTGGTNAFRAAGPGAGLLTGLGDLAKGLVAVGLAALILPGSALAAVIAGLTAIIGHNWSVYIGFRGGAGTAPNLGVLLALSPLSFALAGLAGLIAILTSRIASVASLTVSAVAAASLLFLILIQRDPAPYLFYGLGQLLLVTIALIPNIRRLVDGKERRVQY